MHSSLKLVFGALGAILKWAHLHNKQFCEKGFDAKPPVPVLNHMIATKKKQLRNPMFEICSNGFSHFKLSQPACKSSSLVNGREKC